MTRKEVLQAQIVAAQAWLTRWHASVVSGAYRYRKLQRPTEEKDKDGSFVWRDCTDEEKLTNTMSILKAHAERIQDLTDLLIAEE